MFLEKDVNSANDTSSRSCQDNAKRLILDMGTRPIEITISDCDTFWNEWEFMI